MRPNRELSGYDLLFRKPLWFCLNQHPYVWIYLKSINILIELCSGDEDEKKILSSKNFPSIYSPITIIVIFHILTIFFLDDDGVLMYTFGIYERFLLPPLACWLYMWMFHFTTEKENFYFSSPYIFFLYLLFWWWWLIDKAQDDTWSSIMTEKK